MEIPSNETIPVAVIMGWGEAVGFDEQKEARVDWVVTKPFRAERIGELAQEICDRRKTPVKRLLSGVAA